MKDKNDLIDLSDDGDDYCACGSTETEVIDYAGQKLMQCHGCGKPQLITGDNSTIQFITFVNDHTRTEIQKAMAPYPGILKRALAIKTELEDADFNSRYNNPKNIGNHHQS